MTLNNLMVGFESWSFGEYGVPFIAITPSNILIIITWKIVIPTRAASDIDAVKLFWAKSSGFTSRIDTITDVELFFTETRKDRQTDRQTETETETEKTLSGYPHRKLFIL